MVSGESETFVTRVRRVSARARRVETKPLDVSVGRVYSQTVGAVRWGLGRREPTRYLARGAESDGARAQRTRHRGHGACVSLDALQAMAPRPTSPASWACERQRQIPNEPFSHVLFSVSLTCRIAPIAGILRGSHWPRR